MQQEFRKRLRQAARRRHVQVLLDAAATAAVVAGAGGVAAVAVEKVFGLHAPPVGLAAALAGPAVLYVLLRGWQDRPRPMSVALEIDQRLALRERFSTTLALAARDDPFAEAARAETYARAARLDLRGHFPLRFARRWAAAFALVLLAWVAGRTVPSLDLLGREARAQAETERAQALAEARAEAEEAAARIEALAKRMGDEDIAQEALQLAAIDPAATPAEIKRQTIRKLGALAEKIQRGTPGENRDLDAALRKRLKQLRDPGDGLARDMARDLARGNFAAAAAKLRTLQDRLASLPAAEREALEAQLANLADQLAKFAADSKALRDALRRAGVDPNLANLSEEELREALERSGLDADRIERLLNSARCAQRASKLCRGLASGLGKCCSGLPGGRAVDGDGLAVLSDRLSDLEALQARAGLAAAMLADVEGRMAELGAGQNESLAGIGDIYQLPGTRGPGIGTGSAKIEADWHGHVETTPTRVPNRETDDPGPIIAVWETYEDQVRGESKAEARQTIRAARDRAADAVTAGRIPSKYHDAVTRYFDELESPQETAP